MYINQRRHNAALTERVNYLSATNTHLRERIATLQDDVVAANERASIAELEETEAKDRIATLEAALVLATKRAESKTRELVKRDIAEERDYQNRVARVSEAQAREYTAAWRKKFPKIAELWDAERGEK